jgi:hypothetical protein
MAGWRSPDSTTDYFVLQLQTFLTFVGGDETDPAMTELATTGLTNKRIISHSSS